MTEIGRYSNIGGVTCYMNSILHILQNSILCDFLFSEKFINTIKEKYTQDKCKELISFQLYKIFRLSHKLNTRITPTTFRMRMGAKNSIWTDHEQQDSHEFFTALINLVEDEVKTKVVFIGGKKIPRELNIDKKNVLINLMANKKWEQFIKKEYSPLKKLFSGMIKSTLKCENCNIESHNFETFTTLELPIPFTNPTQKFTLEDCLNHYTKKEKLDEKNKVKCAYCQRFNCAEKSIEIWKTPKILVINLKRFLTNNFGQIIRKINNLVKYEKSIDILNFISDKSQFKNMSKFNLFGVNIHHEIHGINFGHYTAFVRNRSDNKWYCFNDDKEAIKLNNIVSNKAYNLFFIRED
jgi:ubiquitin C-terminal hydrolase